MCDTNLTWIWFKVFLSLPAKRILTLFFSGAPRPIWSIDDYKIYRIRRLNCRKRSSGWLIDKESIQDKQYRRFGGMKNQLLHSGEAGGSLGHIFTVNRIMHDHRQSEAFTREKRVRSGTSLCSVRIILSFVVNCFEWTAVVLATFFFSFVRIFLRTCSLNCND